MLFLLYQAKFIQIYFCASDKFAVVSKYEKLGKYLSYCTRDHLIVRPDSSVVKSVCTVSTRAWVRIPLGPTFYIESKNLSSK